MSSADDRLQAAIDLLHVDRRRHVYQQISRESFAIEDDRSGRTFTRREVDALVHRGVVEPVPGVPGLFRQPAP